DLARRDALAAPSREPHHDGRQNGESRQRLEDPAQPPAARRALALLPRHRVTSSPRTPAPVRATAAARVPARGGTPGRRPPAPPPARSPATPPGRRSTPTPARRRWDRA